MPPLTNTRHERFVQGLLKGKSACEAYEDAGFTPDRGNATRLHANRKVQTRLSELQAEVAKETKVTVEGLLKELEDARAKATDLKQLSAAVRAVEAKAKVSGLLVQKVEVGGPDEFSNTKDEADVFFQMSEADNPELADYLKFTDEDRATIRHYMEKIWDVLQVRVQEARDARVEAYTGRAAYRPERTTRQIDSKPVKTDSN